MCGQDGHIHDTFSQYDHATGVLRFIQKCVPCVWSKVIHEQAYRPQFWPLDQSVRRAA